MGHIDLLKHETFNHWYIIIIIVIIMTIIIIIIIIIYKHEHYINYYYYKELIKLFYDFIQQNIPINNIKHYNY